MVSDTSNRPQNLICNHLGRHGATVTTSYGAGAGHEPLKGKQFNDLIMEKARPAFQLSPKASFRMIWYQSNQVLEDLQYAPVVLQTPEVVQWRNALVPSF